MLWHSVQGAGGLVGGGAPIAFVSSSANKVQSSTSLTIVAPTNIQDGDLLVCFFYAAANSTSSLPSGFTTVYQNNSQLNPRIMVGWKVASSESGNYTCTASQTNLSGSIIVYRNATFDKVGVLRRDSSTDTATAPNISPSSPGVLLAGFSAAIVSGVVVTPPSGMTQRAITPSAISAPTSTVYDEEITAGATGNRTLTWNSNSLLSGILLSLI